MGVASVGAKGQAGFRGELPTEVFVVHRLRAGQAASQKLPGQPGMPFAKLGEEHRVIVPAGDHQVGPLALDDSEHPALEFGRVAW